MKKSHMYHERYKDTDDEVLKGMLREYEALLTSAAHVVECWRTDGESSALALLSRIVRHLGGTRE